MTYKTVSATIRNRTAGIVSCSTPGANAMAVRAKLSLVSRRAGPGIQTPVTQRPEPALTVEHPGYSKAAQLFASSIPVGAALEMHFNQATSEDFELKARVTEAFQFAVRNLNEPRLSGLHIGMALLEMAQVQMMMYADDDPFGHEL